MKTETATLNQEQLAEECANCGHRRGQHAAYGKDCPELDDNGEHQAWILGSKFTPKGA